MGGIGDSLAYVARCLPARDPAGRIELARRFGLGLELANHIDFDADPYRSSGVPLVTLQAFQMHEAHPLHPDPDRRTAAVAHVEQTIQLASELDIPRVLTVCGFGLETINNPLERCIEFFSQLAAIANKYGVRILIELLSPKRCAAMTDPADISRLLDALGRPDVFAAAFDTGHLLDAGRDPNTVFRGWSHSIEEVQLRGPAGAAPTTDLPIIDWLAGMPGSPAVVAVEHREAISHERLESLINHLRSFDPLV